MEITRELIQQFLANECDPTAFEFVLHYLETHPEEADHWLGSDDWKAIDETTKVTDHDQREVYARLRERLFSEKATDPEALFETRPGRVRRMAWPAVAASLLLLAGGGLWMSKRRVHAPAVASLAAQTPLPVKDTLRENDRWIIRDNAGRKPQKLVLPDGSGVVLYAHSRLSYTKSFGVTNRESHVTGEADFSVFKNKAVPFTVHSGVLSTTALGTSFGVKASAAAIAIRLYTGRVVVKAERSTGWSRDIFLSPGEQVSYNGKGGPALVSRFGSRPTDKVTNDQQNLVFNNTALKDVFKQLSIQYHVTISYRAKDLSGMNFTGTVSRSDSLQPFLRLLGNMNNLDIQEEAGGFRIVRQQ